MLVAAAFVPIPPLLVPEIAGGTAAADQRMRDACRAAVGRLLEAAPDDIAVVGPGDSDGPVDGGWDWRGFGVPLPNPAPPRRLPLGLAIGDWLLDTYGATPPRRFHSVAPSFGPAQCAELGRDLVAGDGRAAWPVGGAGPPCRTEKAPGHFDPAAEAWDTAALAALQHADPGTLHALDADVGRRLLAAGRAPWQVL